MVISIIAFTILIYKRNSRKASRLYKYLWSAITLGENLLRQQSRDALCNCRGIHSSSAAASMIHSRPRFAFETGLLFTHRFLTPLVVNHRRHVTLPLYRKLSIFMFTEMTEVFQVCCMDAESRTI